MTPTTKAGRAWDSVRNWLGLDVWMMLGRDPMKYPGWSADVWAEMMAAVKAPAAEAEALRAERDRLRKALTSIAEFSNEPEAMMAADALATPAASPRCPVLSDEGFGCGGDIGHDGFHLWPTALATPAPAAPGAATFDAGADAHAETYRKGWEAGRAEAEALRAALSAMTVCDVCMSLFWGSAWCHDQRTAQVAALATPAPATPAEPECVLCGERRVAHGPAGIRHPFGDAPAAPAECAHRLITFTHPGCLGCGRLLERESLTEDTARVFTPEEPER